MLGRIIEHASTFPRPTAEWPTAYVEKLVADSPFTKGTLVSGFERVTSHKGEKGQGQSCREVAIESLRGRQGQPLSCPGADRP